VTSEMHRQPDWVWTVWLGFRRPKVWHKAGGLQIWQSSLAEVSANLPLSDYERFARNPSTSRLLAVAPGIAFSEHVPVLINSPTPTAHRLHIRSAW